MAGNQQGQGIGTAGLTHGPGGTPQFPGQVSIAPHLAAGDAADGSPHPALERGPGGGETEGRWDIGVGQVGGNPVRYGPPDRAGRRELRCARGKEVDFRYGPVLLAQAQGAEGYGEDGGEIGYRLRHKRRPQRRTSPLPNTIHFWLVSPSRPTGPRAWILSVEMPISAPRPYSKPSAKRVEALTITEAESTSRRKRMARL